MVLTEVLVAMVLGLVILGATVQAFTDFLGLNARSERHTQAQDTARTAIDRMAQQLRSAMSTGAAASQPIVQHSSYDIVFLAPSGTAGLSDNPRRLVYVRYCLDGTNPADQKLWRQETTYSSSSQATPPSTTTCPSTAWTRREAFASNLVNQLQSPPRALFTTPTDGAGNVTDVAIHAVVDVDPAKAPGATALQTKVSLRNLNRPPAATLTCQALTNGHVLCDASASTDPDAQTLTFAWEVDSSPVTEGGYRLDQGSLAAGSTHTFKVKVTDSGGLTATATRTVTMPT